MCHVREIGTPERLSMGPLHCVRKCLPLCLQPLAGLQGRRETNMEIKKVLLIDDEADIRTIGKISLVKVGRWQVVLAARGAEGVDLAVRERPDVILLDVMMPEMDGPATLAR